MERDCFYNELKYVRDYACKAAGLDPEIAGWKTAVDAMTKQLADAQATVEALQKKYDDLLGKYHQLVDFYDKHNGTPCEQIRHQQQVDALQRVRDEFERERDQLHAALMEAKAVKLRDERDRLRKALRPFAEVGDALDTREFINLYERWGTSGKRHVISMQHLKHAAAVYGATK